MPLVRRVRNLLTAHLYDAVESLEDPERLLRQTIRELEATLAQATQAAARALAAERMLDHELTRRRQGSARAREQAVRALQRQDEAAARQALARQCWADRQTEALAVELARAREQNSLLRQRMENMQLQLTQARQDATAAIARQQVTEAHRVFHQARSASGANDNIAARLEHLCAKSALAEAEAAAWIELTEPAAVEPFDAAEAQAARIEELLGELRASLQSD